MHGQDELNDYYRLLTVLEREVLRANKDLESFNEEDSLFTATPLSARNGKVEGGPIEAQVEEGNAGNAAGLTLLRMRTWMQEPIDRCGGLLFSSSLLSFPVF